MVHPNKPGSQNSYGKKTLLCLFFVAACVLGSGCVIPTSRNSSVDHTTAPAITPSIPPTTPAVIPTPAPPAVTTPGIRKGVLNVSVGDYPAGLPVRIFLDNVSVGNVTRDRPLNLTADAGRHTVRACVLSSCIQEEVLVISSEPSSLDLEDRLKKEIVTGPLRVSIGGYNAELPVIIDNTTVGNVSQNTPLNLMLGEGRHVVKVCVGVLCVNETVEIMFAKPVFVDFGERLKNVAEFATPTIRIVDTRRTGNTVTVDVEFINPGRSALTMTAVIQLSYSYVNPQTHWRAGTSRQGTLTRTVQAGNTTVQSLNFTLTGGSAYIIEIPVILESSVR